MNNSKTVSVPKLRLWLFITLAMLTTYIGAVLASGGWSILFVFVFYGWFSVFVSVVFLIFALRSRGFDTVVTKRFIILLLSSLVLVVLFSPSDCGDAPGSLVAIFYLFDQLFSHGANMCSDNLISVSLKDLAGSVYLLHVILLVWLLINHIKINPRQSQGVRFLFATLLLFVIFVASFVGAYHYMAKFNENKRDNWMIAQGEQASMGAPYAFSIIPTENVCIGENDLSVSEVLHIVDQLGLGKPTGGYWSIRFRKVGFYADEYQVKQVDDCVWLVIENYLTERGHYTSSNEVYIIDDETSEVNVVENMFTASSKPVFKVYLPR